MFEMGASGSIISSSARSKSHDNIELPNRRCLNFTGIDFPTIDRLERQNTNLAINVFGWENGRVVIHRISEKGGETLRINLMLTKQGENTHYSFVKRLSAFLYDQTRQTF